MNISKFLLFLICLMLTPGLSTAAPLSTGNTPATPQASAALQTVITRGLALTGAPGIVIRVSTPAWTWSSAAGSAALSPPVKASPLMCFRIASVSKTFTAAAIMKLAGEKKLHLDDTVERWLPHTISALLPCHAKITVRMLLEHRSGIADRDLALLMARQNSKPDVPLPLEEAIATGIDRGACTPPGKEWHYSNEGYVLLSLIIESASGSSYEDYLRRAIFKPLQLTSTIAPTNPSTRTIAGTHMGCIYRDKEHGAWVDGTDRYMTWSRGAGDLISTTEDLEKFHRALRHGGLIKPDMFRNMHTFIPLPSQPGISTIRNALSEYGLGYARSSCRVPAVTLEGHGGGYSGAVTAMLYWVEGDAYITFNTNGSCRPGCESAFILPLIECLEKLPHYKR
jgi:D-alanyl-D-alanine carboxypeptidase